MRSSAIFVAISVMLLAGWQLSAGAQSSSPPRMLPRRQDPYQPPSTVHGKTILIPIGTTMEGRIDRTISSSGSRAGQRFGITVSSPLLLNGQDVIIPAGSQILGEVVEAMPAGEVAHPKGEPKNLVRGKLEVQLNGMRTPDGITYPLVANLVPDKMKDNNSGSQTPLGTGVVYVGTPSSFEAVAPGRNNHQRGGGLHVASRQDVLNDPLLGLNDQQNRSYNNDATIRSLVLKSRNYYIFAGSPLTVRLQAPFKIGITPQSLGAPISDQVPSNQPSNESQPPSVPSIGTADRSAPPSVPSNGTADRSAPLRSPTTIDSF